MQRTVLASDVLISIWTAAHSAVIAGSRFPGATDASCLGEELNPAIHLVLLDPPLTPCFQISLDARDDRTLRLFPLWTSALDLGTQLAVVVKVHQIIFITEDSTESYPIAAL